MRFSSSVLLCLSLFGEALLVSAAEQLLRGSPNEDGQSQEKIDRSLQQGGQGNSNGQVVHEKTFSFVASAGDYDQCFDFDSFCWRYFSRYMNAFDFGSDAYARAYAGYATVCHASAQSYAQSIGFIVGEGSFNVTRNGNAGSVDGIHLDMGINSATWVSTRVGTDASSYTSASSSAYISTDGAKLCEFLRTTYSGYWWSRRYYYEYLCAEADSSASSYSTGYGQSYSSGIAGSQAIGDTTVENTIVVEGPNLQKFESFLNFEVSSFTTAFSDSESQAWVRSFASSSDIVRTQVCKAAVPQSRAYYCRYYSYRYYDSYNNCMADDRYYNYCDTAHSYAFSNAQAYARALADAYASAIANLNLSITAKASFERTSGNSKNDDGGDLITFDAQGSANGYARAYCSARA